MLKVSGSLCSLNDSNHQSHIVKYSIPKYPKISQNKHCCSTWDAIRLQQTAPSVAGPVPRTSASLGAVPGPRLAQVTLCENTFSSSLVTYLNNININMAYIYKYKVYTIIYGN